MSEIIAKKLMLCPLCKAMSVVCIDEDFNLHFECLRCSYGFNTFDSYEVI